MIRSAEISTTVAQAATEAGFDLVGITPVDDAPELEYFPRWIADGRGGEMKYLEARDEQGHLKRASLAHAAPWARSVVVCAINYNTAQPYSTQVSDESINVQERGWISRYAWGEQDYHDSVMPRLRQVERALRAAVGANDLVTRCYVDTGPIVERVVAKYAGIGWIGKNTCIINQKMGSWLFLGVILTSLDLEADSGSDSKVGVPAPDRCGSCTRCIDACPTNALTAPRQMDASRCIAYLTIEKRGEIPGELRADMGRQVFGCDICQDVCPWNRRAPASADPDLAPRGPLVNPALDWLAEMDEAEFGRWFNGSPVRRAKWGGLRRNLAIAMGNSGQSRFLPILRQWSADTDPVVADAARWAIQSLRRN